MKRGVASLAFTEFFKEKLETIRFGREHSFPDEPAKYVLPEKPSLYGVLIFMWCWMHSKRSVMYVHRRGDVYTPISKNAEERTKFAEMINLMQ